MRRYTARLKADYQAKPWLKVGANMSYTNFLWNNSNSDEGSAGSTGNIFGTATMMAPIYPLYIRDGEGNIMKDQWGHIMYDYGDGANGGQNRPTSPNSNALSSAMLDVDRSEGNAFTGTGFAEVRFLKDFTFTFNAGVGLDETRTQNMNNMYYGQFAPNGGTLSVGHSRYIYYNLQQILNYNKTFAQDHTITAMLGHENYSTTSKSLSGYKTRLFSPENLELNGAVIDGQNTASSMSTYNTEGYFGRVQYDYKNTVFVSASYRRDASSRFHPNHRWGNFWSAGAAWIISKEPWFKASWIDMLKLKASIGSQGNDGIGNYRYTDTYSLSNNDGQLAISFSNKGKEDISWETNTNFNAGIEFELLKSRINGSVEYFYRKTSDMLFWFTVPASLGYSGYYDNIGDMRNQGIEFNLDFAVIRNRDFQWNINLNGTHYRNKIIRLPDERKTRTVEGYEGYASGNKFVGEGLPLNTFLMSKYAGIDHEDGLPMWYMDLKEDPNDPEKVTGQTTTKKYSDATQYLCSNTTPDLYGGFGTDLAYKGLDFSVQFTYNIGGRTYDSGYARLMANPEGTPGYSIHQDILNAWTPENTTSDIPRFVYKDTNITAASDRFLVPASYLNIQNAQIGYTFPQKWTKKIGVSRLRLYATCDNVWYWSFRKGLDPRQSFTGATNNASNSPVRTISGGINITF
jgi:TonB-linked SusC/RagA family outer membrane protein